MKAYITSVSGNIPDEGKIKEFNSLEELMNYSRSLEEKLIIVPMDLYLENIKEEAIQLYYKEESKADFHVTVYDEYDGEYIEL